MKGKTLKQMFGGLAALSASLLVFTSVGYKLADTFRSAVDGALGTQSYITNTEDAKYVSDYASNDELAKALREFAVRQGQEGTVIMKNDNSALPLAAKSKVALFGVAAYNNYFSGANTGRITLEQALTDAGFTVNAELKTATNNSGVTPNTSVGDYKKEGYQIKEASPDKYPEIKTAAEGLTDDTTGIVVFMRPGGEGSTWYPGVARDTEGNTLNQNPLAFSPEELAVVDLAKETCGKVIVLLNTYSPMEVEPLTEGEHEVDGIVYAGVPSAFQFEGIVDVLEGAVNSTGALADTFAVSSTSSPAMMNFGGSTWSDYQVVATKAGEDWRWDTDISNDVLSGSFGGSGYAASTYVVEAEGIYTGYNYYETRYYDSVVNPAYNASKATANDAKSGGWNYSDEVTYTFGYGLSYIPYTQKITNVEVEDRADGNITATVAVTNNGDKDGLFLAQLYVAQPYTQYDKTNLVEKSAIMFLNSAKVEVAAGKTENVEISIPTKYLASYDYSNAKTYILDAGNYYFTAAAGAHNAVNNVLTAQGYTKDDGMDAAGIVDSVITWKNAGSETSPDKTTYSISAETKSVITNQADNADINYYLKDSKKVTYLSRQDWSGTYPVNYNTINNGQGFSLQNDAKSTDVYNEWVNELRNNQYVIKNNEPVENLNGVLPEGFEITQNEDGSYVGTWSIIDAQMAENFNDPRWDDVINSISADEAIGAVAHGGSQSDTLTNLYNPIVGQNDGPTGFNNGKIELSDGTSFATNVNSQSLMGSSFNPDLAYDWGKLLGNTGLMIQKYEIWAGGLNYHRCPYNARNIEYLSEDPMLTNVLGVGLIEGSKEKGIIVGPKHIGFNDQEYQRSGVGVYMNEQKLRQTDLRGFEGAIADADALGMMIAFNRIGAINASHHVGMNMGIFRGEWGFLGLATTDMMNDANYFNPESCIMAGLTMMADFRGNNSTIGGADGKDATWGYLSVESVSNDNTLVEQARLCMKYQLYAFANSAILNVSTTAVTPWWDSALQAVNIVFIVTTCLLGAAWVVFEILPIVKKKEA